jgi:hypothetical protein
MCGSNRVVVELVFVEEEEEEEEVGMVLSATTYLIQNELKTTMNTVKLNPPPLAIRLSVSPPPLMLPAMSPRDRLKSTRFP